MRRAAKGPFLRPLALLLCLASPPLAALEVPALSARVNDVAGLLDAATRSELEASLAAYAQKTGHQLAVLIIPSLEGQALETFSMRVAEQWKLGDAKRDDGLLLLVAVADRAVRIEVGRGLEGAVTDVLSSRIIREVLVPAFRANDFGGGLRKGLLLLQQAASGEAVGLPERGTVQDVQSWPRALFELGILLAVLLSLGRAMRRRPFGGIGTGGFYGGGGFGGGGFSSGGFSGGGGSFGGGGASGRW